MPQMHVIFLDSGRHFMTYLGVNDKGLSLQEELWNGIYCILSEIIFSEMI